MVVVSVLLVVRDLTVHAKITLITLVMVFKENTTASNMVNGLLLRFLVNQAIIVKGC